MSSECQSLQHSYVCHIQHISFTKNYFFSYQMIPKTYFILFVRTFERIL